MNEHATWVVHGEAGFESICACGWQSFALPSLQEAVDHASAHVRRIVTLPSKDGSD